MKNIGIDIGGTFIKSAIVDEKGKILISSKTPTPKDGRMIPSLVAKISREMAQKLGVDFEKINSIGIGTTGVCDSKNGIVVSSANIENYSDLHICEFVKKECGKDTFLDNDANCAALGEYALSGECESFVFITLGTGVGGGIILSGKILRGVNCAAGEIGHMTIVQNGEKCNCGRYGCWERYASVSALVKSAIASGMKGEINGKTIFEYYKQGDPIAREVVDKWLCYVAEGVCNMVNIFQPEVIVIGGGVTREGDLILNPIKEFVGENSMTGRSKELLQTDIRISKLFNDAGVVGASFLYTQKQFGGDMGVLH